MKSAFFFFFFFFCQPHRKIDPHIRCPHCVSIIAGVVYVSIFMSVREYETKLLPI